MFRFAALCCAKFVIALLWGTFEGAKVEASVRKNNMQHATIIANWQVLRSVWRLLESSLETSVWRLLESSLSGVKSPKKVRWREVPRVFMKLSAQKPS